MAGPLIIIALTLVVMQLCVIFDWKIKTKHFAFDWYWIVCLIGALLCICCRFISWGSLKNVFVAQDGMNPLQILVIFISASSISVLLDKIGFFNYIAKLTLNKSKSSQTKLFLYSTWLLPFWRFLLPTTLLSWLLRHLFASLQKMPK